MYLNLVWYFLQQVESSHNLDWWSLFCSMSPCSLTCYFGQHIPNGWWLEKTNSLGFLKHKGFSERKPLLCSNEQFLIIHMISESFMFTGFHRSCLYCSDLSNSFPHFGSIELTLNIPWNTLYMWLKVYSIQSKMASKSVTKYALTWKRGKQEFKYKMIFIARIWVFFQWLL